MATSGVTVNTFAINVNGIIVTGIGRSEEEAREDAIKQISYMVKESPVAPPGASFLNPEDTYQFGAKNQASENMIGKLQEFCQAKYLPFPVYTLEKVQGPSHLPNFSMKCKVLGFTAVGSGTTKKEAKQNAAKMVYNSVTKYAECGHKGAEFKSNVPAICSSANVEDTKNSESKPPNPTLSSANVEDTKNSESKPPKSTLLLPDAERTVSSQQKLLILQELSSRDTKSAVELCGSSDDLIIPPVLNNELKKEILFEEQPEQKEEISESGKPLALPAVEDVLCMQLKNLLTTNIED